MVMRRVHRNLSAYGGESRVERIARTERSHLSKSPPLPTSTKKLVHLAHQIQGKTVEDALVQMRFSKKKMAREVRWQLEEARDTAVVQHGIGPGPPHRRAAARRRGHPDLHQGRPPPRRPGPQPPLHRAGLGWPRPHPLPPPHLRRPRPHVYGQEPFHL